MIRVDRKLNSTDVLDALTDLFILRGPPEYIRSDNGPEFIAQKVRDWIAAVGAVRRQVFWNQWWPKLRESSAHLCGLIMRRVGGDSSVAFRVSFV